MINMNVLAGSTDVSCVIRIIDSTDGTPETGVVYNTSGIDLEYRRDLAASVDITEATLAALTTAHADGGFLHIGNGYYRLDLPDAAVAASAANVLVHGTVTGMIVIGCFINLTPVPVDVRQFGGTAGTSSGGRPEVNVSHNAGSAITSASGRQEVNLSHIAGSAVSASSAQLGVNVVQISSDATAADNAESFFDGTGYKDVDNLYIIRSNTAQAGAAGTITLDASASASNDFYNNCFISIISGTGANQARFISAYVGATKVASVNANWVTNPASDSVFIIWPFGSIPGATAPTAADIWTYGTRVVTAATNITSTGGTVPITAGGLTSADVTAISTDTGAADALEIAFDGTTGAVPELGIVRQGTGQSATGTTFVLDSSASFADDVLNGMVLAAFGSTQGYWQFRQIIDYTNSSDTCTVDTWTVTPSGTLTFKVWGAPPSSTSAPPPVNVTQIAGAAVNTAAAQLGVNVVEVSADAVAADNLEAAFDGTGYAGGTIKQQVDVRQFGGTNATTAAGRAEVNLSHIAGSAVSTSTAQLGVNLVNVAGSAVSASSGLLNANATQISGDSTAADNAESFFDGTGYAGTNNVIPTVTTLTGHTAQTGDAYGRLGAPTGASVSADVAVLMARDSVYVKNVAVSNFVWAMKLTDGSAGTGLTITAQVSKDGGAFATLGGSVTEISGGWYKVNIAQAEMNADEVALKFTATGARQLDIKLRTQS